MNDWPDVIELKGYTPKPGDVLFLTFKGQLSEAHIRRMRYEMETAIPGVKCIVLCEGATVRVPE